MLVAFIDRHPTEMEESLLMLTLSTYCDGSGSLICKNGDVKPGWRDAERCVAAALNGIATESKGIFDVLLMDPTRPNTYLGIDVKTKAASNVKNRRYLASGGLKSDCRAYLEVSNSDAEFWSVLNKKGITSSNILEGNNPQIAGKAIIDTINGWHEKARREHVCLSKGATIDIEKSIYLALSYSTDTNLGEYWQFHSFPLQLRHADRWTFKIGKGGKKSRSIVGYDPDYPREVLYEYYYSSGSQFKYYPRISSAQYCSRPFKLRKPKPLSLLEKVKEYWPEEYAKLRYDV